MNFNNYTQKSLEAVQSARDLAVQNNHQQMEQVHLLLALLRLSLPSPVLEFAGIISGANAFLSMLMVGVGFELSGDRTQLGAIVRTLLPKYLFGMVMSIVCFRFLPMPLAYRQALAILFFAPIPSAAPAFTADMGGDYGLASAANSIAILVSIVAIVITLLLVI